jgi:hypothetical protein
MTSTSKTTHKIKGEITANVRLICSGIKRARAADKDPDFSCLIREELPKGD